MSRGTDASRPWRFSSVELLLLYLAGAVLGGNWTLLLLSLFGDGATLGPLLVVIGMVTVSTAMLRRTRLRERALGS